MDVQGPFKLRDYVHTQTSDGYNRGLGVIDVYGTFIPICRLFHGSRLHNGATIDFTGYGASVPLPLPTVALFAASQAGDKTLRFEPGATIGVKLGAREVEKGTRVISWDSETAPDTTVRFVCDDTDKKYKLVKKSDGLYLYRGFSMIVR